MDLPDDFQRTPLEHCQCFMRRFALQDGGFVRTDQEGELAHSSSFRNTMLCTFNYVVEPTGADSPSQNGAIKFCNGHLAVKVWMLLYMSSLPPKFWSAVLLHTVYLHNRLVHSVTQRTPFEGHFRVKPDLTYLKLFGAWVCVKRTGKRCRKLDCNDFTGIFLGSLSTDQNIKYLDLTSGIVKTCHHAQFDEAWYLQHEHPPGPQLLYDLGWEVDNIFLSEIGAAPDCLSAPYPPPLPKDSFCLPKFDLPRECQHLHLPLRVTAAPTSPSPVTATAAHILVPRTPSEIVYTYGITSNDMATIYMLPDPYFNAFIEPINLQKVDLSQHRTAGLKLFEWNGRLILGGVETSTPATRIPCWHTRIRGATLLQVGDILVTTIVDVHHMLATSAGKYPSCPLLFAFPEIRQDISHNSLPIMNSGDFSQATHDQLNDRWDFLTLAPWLQRPQSYSIKSSGDVLNYVTQVM
jgi:hypothetical protein